MVKTYLLNDTCYFNGYELIDKKTGNKAPLDPKIAELLGYLIDNPERIISRDELLDQVWSNTVINENTINWSVSQLRKELGDSVKTPAFIKTVSKKGYIFCADVTQVETTRATEKGADTSSIVINHWLLLFMLLSISGIGIYFAFNTSNNDKAIQLSDIKSLTSLDGSEKNLLFTKDKRKIYFLHKAPKEQRYQLYYALINDNRVIPETLPDGNSKLVESTRAIQPQLVINDQNNYLDIVWGINQQSLFAVRVKEDNGNGQCEIVQLELTESGHEITSVNTLVDCQNSRRTKLAYSEQRNTLYFNSKHGSNRYQLFSYQLDSQQLKLELNDDTDGIGYHFLTLDLTQEKLLLLKDNQLRKTEFMLYDLSSCEETLILSFDDFYHSAYFSPDSEYIWHNWGNDLVVAYDIEKGVHSELLKTHVGWNYNLEPVDNTQVIFEVSDGNLSDLVPLVNGKFQKGTGQANEFLPTLFEGGYAYVSTHSGLPQVWNKYQDKPAKQISNLHEYHLFDELVASPSGRYLVGVTQQNLGLLDTQSQRYRSLTNDEYFPRNVRWSPDNVLTFSEYKNESWQAYRVLWDKEEVEVELLPFGNAYITQSVAGGDYLYSKYDENGLYRYKSTEQKSVLINSEFPARTYWRLHGNQVYYIETLQNRALVRRDLTTWQLDMITTLEPTIGGRFDVNLQGEHIIFERTNRAQSNLMTAKLITK